MGQTLQQLERELDRQMRRLAHLLATPGPGPMRVQRVKQAVLQEAARRRRQLGHWKLARAGLCAAAALLLAAGLSGWSAWQAPTRVTSSDPAELLDRWAAAVERSSERVTTLISDLWLAPPAPPPSEEQQLDELLESLERSEGLLLGA